MNYILMHRNVKVAEIKLNELSQLSSIGKIWNPAHLPIGTAGNTGVDKKALARWWATRSIPVSRSGLKEVLYRLDMSVPQELLDKCYGLSLSDQYWINPVEHPFQWEDINFFDNDFSEDVGNLLFGQGEDMDSVSLISPDNTSDGQLMKKWKIIDGRRVLLKGSSRPYYQEALCEVIASHIANCLSIPHVAYQLTSENGMPLSICEDFVTRDTELVSAYHILRSMKKPNNLSDYEFYIQCAENYGVQDIRHKMEQMLVLDFLIANEDRHYNNFGLLRNAVTLEWIGAAPVFDCGTSLWYNTQEQKIKPLSPALSSKPFKKTHHEQIKLVSDFSWIDFTKLQGVEKEARKILSTSEDITKIRCDILCDALSERINLLREIANKR